MWVCVAAWLSFLHFCLIWCAVFGHTPSISHLGEWLMNYAESELITHLHRCTNITHTRKHETLTQQKVSRHCQQKESIRLMHQGPWSPPSTIFLSFLCLGRLILYCCKCHTTAMLIDLHSIASLTKWWQSYGARVQPNKDKLPPPTHTHTYGVQPFKEAAGLSAANTELNVA